MKLLYHSLAVYLSLYPFGVTAAKDESNKKADKPCTITSPATGSFFDLTQLRLQDPTQSKSKNKNKHPRDYSWNATGYDLGYNFTLNFCGPVLEPIADVVGIDKDLWRNTSAYYKQDGKVYSLG
jgi:cation-dependent mannose-6-phosphate receptor